jgi:cleavage stimulation factor subunit 3
MAEEDAEIALLHQLQAGQESEAWDNEGAHVAAEGELPSNTEHNNHEVKKEVAADDQVLRALSPSGADTVSDGGEYDPSSVTLQPAIVIAGEEASRSSSRASTRKRKTIGGFIADDSDEETEASTPAQSSTGLLQAPAASTPKRVPSPLQSSVTQQDVQDTPENQSDSKAVTNSSNIPSENPSSARDSSSQAPATQVLTSAGSAVQNAASFPKARLPNDKTGILEDRIKEDPRGDMDAWLSLIAEHRKRNKLDDARAVYDRFFKVFPQAVSFLFSQSMNHSNRV